MHEEYSVRGIKAKYNKLASYILYDDKTMVQSEGQGVPLGGEGVAGKRKC